MAFPSLISSRFDLRNKGQNMRLFEGTPFDRPPRCDECGELETACRCPPKPPKRKPPAEQTARLAVEKRTKGKVVTVVRGLSDDDTDLGDLLTRLKSTCGAGGTLREGTLEIQGRQIDAVRGALAKLGYRVVG
jgi:translation initiation factor 1